MKVAVLGFGTVGQGVYEMLQHANGLEPGPVLVRPGKDDAPFKVTDIEAVTGDPAVDAVVEVLGGTEPARSWTEAALRAGKHVVTANKALVAAHGPELAAVAREQGVAFLFSAACGGGVPFLHNLALAAQSDRILSVGGILNGTTNYMLDAMQSRGADYAAVLKDAQALGYAEADPSADVSGLDALRKIMLACAVAFEKLPTEGLYTEGIEDLTPADVQSFRQMDLTCRLVARGGIGPRGAVFAFVEPTLVPASAVLRDLSDVLCGQRVMMPAGCVRVTADGEGCGHPYYVRLPAELTGQLPVDRIQKDGDTARVVTSSVTVKWMHDTAARLRAQGAKLFFAGIEG